MTNVRKHIARNRRRVDPLRLTLRVVVRRRMTKETLQDLLSEAIATGTVPLGITLRWLDWASGEEGAAVGGRYMGARLHDALVDFAGALTSGMARTRLALVRP